ACDLDYQITGSEMDALLLEDQFVKKYRPRYNINLKDDKSYPYLKLTVKEEWPRLIMARRKQRDGALYFGPYTGVMAKELLRMIKKIFPFRWCKDSPLKKKPQPCLYFRIGVCPGPCIDRISQAEYRSIVTSIKELLKGKLSRLIGKLRLEMEKASGAKEFETAASLRDRISYLTKIVEKRKQPESTGPEEPKALIKLRDALDLPTLPSRIEAFDISNTSGSYIVASMVVFTDGSPFKPHYRRFMIRSVKGEPNDVRSMNEVVKRRYGGGLSRQLPLPDLILIDGGLPQLGGALAGIKGTAGEGVPMIGLAKKEERIILPDQGKPLELGRESAALQLLQRVRDEANRFAVKYHRLKRARGLFR
ncbi:MAG: UvrB/UvrC motif-containing protein, partial [Candidatus Margulisbacteria bacterium]|nr:UvrB/UvrC motif-containing protein [Candidatus Margulisiibacteriota bacterium]